MKSSHIAVAASAVILAVGLFVGAARQAAAFDLSFLNKMNPSYTRCVSSTRAQLLPQYRDDRKVHDAIIDTCNSRYPAFGK
jgi:hypothetical protein